ncbi:MAG: nucleotidyltransferase protein [Ignavibacteria bacterium]|nr:nucleotidyltransferase protein [Ignavibacteria bacterium]
MFSKNDCIKYAQEFVDKVIAKGINIKYAKLFGSYSKNTQTVDSDIDILLVSDEFKGVGFIDNVLIANELYEFEYIQVKTYSVNDYEEGDPFVEEINKSALQLRIN